MPYSQYVKLRTEVRYNLQMNKHNQLAFRFIAGAGIPYGNSLTLPYVKQFYVGGSNSIRSFIARSIGPGSYRSPDSIDNLYIDQAGDIKLESNLEYRFGIYKFLRGALFVDAGNIWLVNDDPQRQGAKFGFDTFASEIAVGTGWGLRFDFNVIVVRCDWAFPLRKPNLPVDERWVVDGIDVFESKWRRDNVITNISIGYPF
jgi:outer membrane protein insertion porin family